MGMVYLFTAWFEIPLKEFPVLALLSITTIIGFASFGYLVNDLFDIKKDTKAGKKNFLAGKPTPLVILFFNCCSMMRYNNNPVFSFVGFAHALALGLFRKQSLLRNDGYY